MARILLIDDAPDVRLLMREVLELAGHHITEAKNGPNALTLFEAGLLPDAVILDVQMPMVDGWDTLSMLRAHDLAADVPVVMCSVKASVADLSRAWTLGCDGYLSKPFSILDLKAEVEAVINRCKAERLEVRRSRLAAVEEE